jgi:uncharacterized protein YnzC (UPF0291/DUF896 family)
MLTEKEEKELEYLRMLQNSSTRWLSQDEFERINELAEKKFKDAGSPFEEDKTNEK